VLGENGAGKSTLLRILAGLVRPTSGSVAIEGSVLERRTARRRIGYSGHANLLYPTLTARENLCFAGRLYNVANPHERAAELLAEYGLSATAERPVAKLSRGTAQRLALARSLVHDPRILLLDEPFTGLDLNGAQALMQRLRRLRADGRAVIFVTHEIDRATALADAALVLQKGRALLMSAPPQRSDLEAVLGQPVGSAA